MTNPETVQSSSAPTSQPPSDTQPEYANTRGCLWLLLLGIITVAAVVALVVLVGDF